MKNIVRIVFTTALFLALPLALLAQQPFRVPSESGGAFSSFLPFPSAYIDARVLAANVAESHTIPATATRVILSGTCNFYAKPGGTAAVPAADVTDGTASDLNPSGYTFSGQTAIGLIAAETCIVTLRFYSK